MWLASANLANFLYLGSRFDEITSPITTGHLEHLVVITIYLIIKIKINTPIAQNIMKNKFEMSSHL